MTTACLDAGSYLQTIVFFSYVIYYDFSFHALRIHKGNILLINIELYHMNLLYTLNFIINKNKLYKSQNLQISNTSPMLKKMSFLNEKGILFCEKRKGIK